ncbi:MAG: hypothetical protein IJL87_03575 [Clostridia bacterium]|nr:hypothetical protein [Clostridia bacterium]
MKKVTLLVLVLALCMCFMAGCGDKKTDPAGTNSASGQDTPAALGGYIINVKGTDIAVEMEATNIKGMLGEPDKYFESDSCAFQGKDKVYTYGSVVINTYPSGEKDFVMSIELKDDLVETAEGICIGASKEDVIAAYGEPTETTDKAICYVKDYCKLSFMLENGKVSSITYTSTKHTPQ